MMKRLAMCAAAVAVLGVISQLLPTATQARVQQADKKKLADKAMGLLKKHCSECHSEAKLAGTFDVRSYKTLLDKNRKGKPYISKTGGEEGLKESYIWVKISNDSMPQGEEMPEADKTVLKDWIKAGAPEATTEVVSAKREFVSQKVVMESIYKDLDAAEEEDRPYMRYFTFAHLHNNPAVTDATLIRYKAALSKAFNSMHWKKPIIILTPLKDSQGTVFRFDMRDVDWDRKDHEKIDRWTVLLQRYPYGMRFDEVDDDKLAKLDKDLYKMTNRTLVYIRADWFVAMATRPPLYEQILRLPKTAGELEHKLGVDVFKNFRRNRLARAGYAVSGVSGQNRLVERHDSLYGAYWKSYDFKKSSEDQDLLRFPLGPQLFRKYYTGKERYPYDGVAFKHDGGEMIFNLPNGLQAYYLATGDDKYLDKGPVDVVSDKLKTSGTAEIVNGLSCMVCHANGMIPSVLDDVRTGTSVKGDNRRKVRRLYVSRDQMLKYVEEDSKLFQESVTKALKPFMPSDKALQEAFADKSEPVGLVAREYYNPDLSLEKAACELGIEKPETLKGMIEGNEKLQDLGLGGLANKGKVKREFWETRKGQSIYQRTMSYTTRGSSPWNFR